MRAATERNVFQATLPVAASIAATNGFVLPSQATTSLPSCRTGEPPLPCIGG